MSDVWVKNPRIWEAVEKRVEKFIPRGGRLFWARVLSMYRAAGGKFVEESWIKSTSDTEITLLI